uniref:Uncharacterized protein n=1 Tax=Tanacetum cinerariifolium TaxID=118510 RepID=A0A6L2MUI6_TANCI|nr:hypothetical protein [Tanacetum cinerariifolium]
MDLPAFIHVADPTKVRIVKRERSEKEAKLLDYAVGRGSTKHVDSATGGGHDAEIEYVTTAEDTAAGSVAAERPKHPCKKRPITTDASAMPILPFVTSSVSATPEREDGAPLDSVTMANLRSVGLAVRFVIFSDSSHHSSTNAPAAEVDSVIKSDVLPRETTEAVITTSVPHVSPVPVPRVADKVIPQVQQSIFHESTSVDTIKPDATNLSHPPGKELSLGSWEVDSENLHEVFVLHWNVSNDALLDDLDTSKEFIDHLAPLADLLKSRDEEVENLKTQLLLKEAEAAEAARLYIQDAQMSVVNEKMPKLDANLLEMACHLEERFYPHFLATISGRRWILTHGMKLFFVKCLNSSDYLMALGATSCCAINKGVQSEFNSALQELRWVDFPLFAELKSHKDASVEDIMNLLRLEDQVVLGETSLSLALSVSHSRVERIRENIIAQWSALIGVWTHPRSEPLSVQSLMGEASNFDGVPAAAVTTTALSTTFASASSIPLISTDDYEIVGVDGQEGASVDGQGDAQGNATAFSTVEFEKEELDTTLTRDPPS